MCSFKQERRKTIIFWRTPDTTNLKQVRTCIATPSTLHTFIPMNVFQKYDSAFLKNRSYESGNNILVYNITAFYLSMCFDFQRHTCWVFFLLISKKFHGGCHVLSCDQKWSYVIGPSRAISFPGRLEACNLQNGRTWYVLLILLRTSFCIHLSEYQDRR